MEPLLNRGDIAFYRPLNKSNRLVKEGLIVIAKHPLMPEKLIVKRLSKIESNGVFLIGENKIESQDSRHFGIIHFSQIIGIVEKVFSLSFINSIKQ